MTSSTKLSEEEGCSSSKLKTLYSALNPLVKNDQILAKGGRRTLNPLWTELQVPGFRLRIRNKSMRIRNPVKFCADERNSEMKEWMSSFKFCEGCPAQNSVLLEGMSSFKFCE